MSTGTSIRAVRPEPAWHQVARTIHLLLFLAIIIGSVTAGAVYVGTHSRGLSRPTATHTRPFTTHGRTVYITPQQEQRVRWLMYFVLPGIPVIFVLSGLLALCGVRLFDRDASPDEVFDRLPPGVRNMMNDAQLEAQKNSRNRT